MRGLRRHQMSEGRRQPPRKRAAIGKIGHALSFIYTRSTPIDLAESG
jgi:hypothetical protein